MERRIFLHCYNQRVMSVALNKHQLNYYRELRDFHIISLDGLVARSQFESRRYDRPSKHSIFCNFCLEWKLMLHTCRKVFKTPFPSYAIRNYWKKKFQRYQNSYPTIFLTMSSNSSSQNFHRPYESTSVLVSMMMARPVQYPPARDVSVFHTSDF